MTVYGFPAPAARWEALWSRPERHVGMPNLGDTCFVSAVVQVLLRVAPLRAMVDKHAETCRLTARRCAVCALSQQARVLLEARGAGGGPEGRAPIAAAARRGLLGKEFKPRNRLDPRGRPRCAPRCFQDGPRGTKISSRGFKASPRHPKMLPRQSQDPPRCPKFLQSVPESL